MTTVWIIRAGAGSRLASDFVEHGVAALGWAGIVGDLRRLVRWDLVQDLERAHVTQPDRDADELIDFRDQVMVGHYVVTPDALTRGFIVGRIASPYDYVEATPIEDEEDGPHRHLRKVEWFGRGRREDLPADLAKELHWRRAIRRLPARAGWERVVEELRDSPHGAEVRAREPRARSSSGAGRGAPRAPRKAAAPAAPKPAVVADQVCPGCQMRRPVHQFVAGVPWCADCRADL